MNNKLQIRKADASLQKQTTHQHSGKGGKIDWVMLILNFIIQVLTAILTNWKGGKKRLER